MLVILKRGDNQVSRQAAQLVAGDVSRLDGRKTGHSEGELHESSEQRLLTQ
jgi:hypothetical protein